MPASVLLIAFCIFAAAAGLSGQSTAPAAAQAMVNRYCLGCHNEDLRIGGVSLAGARATAVGAGANTWEKVFRKVRTGGMPPLGLPRPDASMSASLDQHRANPACASRHARLDPLGFALENYDAVGRFRTSEGGAEIDASGSLPGGITVRGPGGLKKILLDRRDEFVEGLAEKGLAQNLPGALKGRRQLFLPEPGDLDPEPGDHTRIQFP